jgi:hypothetical protein
MSCALEKDVSVSLVMLKRETALDWRKDLNGRNPWGRENNY